MTQRFRLNLAAWAMLAVAFAGLAMGDRWIFTTAVVSVALLWIWRGGIDWCDGPTAHRPKGVRIMHPDGSVTPCEPAYRGLDEDGLHEWVVVTILHVGDRVYCAKLPGRTSLVFPTDNDVTGVSGDGRLDYRMEGE